MGKYDVTTRQSFIRIEIASGSPTAELNGQIEALAQNLSEAGGGNVSKGSPADQRIKDIWVEAKKSNVHGRVKIESVTQTNTAAVGSQPPRQDTTDQIFNLDF